MAGDTPHATPYAVLTDGNIDSLMSAVTTGTNTEKIDIKNHGAQEDKQTTQENESQTEITDTDSTVLLPEQSGVLCKEVTTPGELNMENYGQEEDSALEETTETAKLPEQNDINKLRTLQDATPEGGNNNIPQEEDKHSEKESVRRTLSESHPWQDGKAEASTQEEEILINLKEKDINSALAKEEFNVPSQASDSSAGFLPDIEAIQREKKRVGHNRGESAATLKEEALCCASDDCSEGFDQAPSNQDIKEVHFHTTLEGEVNKSCFSPKGAIAQNIQQGELLLYRLHLVQKNQEMQWVSDGPSASNTAAMVMFSDTTEKVTMYSGPGWENDEEKEGYSELGTQEECHQTEAENQDEQHQIEAETHKQCLHTVTETQEKPYQIKADTQEQRYQAESENQGERYQTESENQGERYQTESENQGECYQTELESQGQCHQTESENQGECYQTELENQGVHHETESENREECYQTESENQGERYQTESENQGERYQTESEDQRECHQTESENQEEHYIRESQTQQEQYQTVTETQEKPYQIKADSQEQRHQTESENQGEHHQTESVIHEECHHTESESQVECHQTEAKIQEEQNLIEEETQEKIHQKEAESHKEWDQTEANDQEEQYKTSRADTEQHKQTIMKDLSDDDQNDSGVSADFFPGGIQEFPTLISKPLEETPIQREIRQALERQKTLWHSRGLEDWSEWPQQPVEIPVKLPLDAPDESSGTNSGSDADKQLAKWKMLQDINQEVMKEQALKRMGNIPGFSSRDQAQESKERKMPSEASHQCTRMNLQGSSRGRTFFSSSFTAGDAKNHAVPFVSVLERTRSLELLTSSQFKDSRTPLSCSESDHSPVFWNKKAYQKKHSDGDAIYRSSLEAQSSLRPSVSLSLLDCDSRTLPSALDEKEDEDCSILKRKNPFFQLRPALSLRPDVEKEIREAVEREQELRRLRSTLYGDQRNRMGDQQKGNTHSCVKSSSAVPDHLQRGKLTLIWPPPSSKVEVESAPLKPTGQRPALHHHWETSKTVTLPDTLHFQKP